MSDDDRLADYLRRIEGDNTPRVLDDGCPSCAASLVSCHIQTYLHGSHAHCCDTCGHEVVT